MSIRDVCNEVTSMNDDELLREVIRLRKLPFGMDGLKPKRTPKGYKINPRYINR